MFYNLVIAVTFLAIVTARPTDEHDKYELKHKDELKEELMKEHHEHEGDNFFFSEEVVNDCMKESGLGHDDLLKLNDKFMDINATLTHAEDQMVHCVAVATIITDMKVDCAKAIGTFHIHITECETRKDKLQQCFDMEWDAAHEHDFVLCLEKAL